MRQNILKYQLKIHSMSRNARSLSQSRLRGAGMRGIREGSLDCGINPIKLISCIELKTSPFIENNNPGFNILSL